MQHILGIRYAVFLKDELEYYAAVKRSVLMQKVILVE